MKNYIYIWFLLVTTFVNAQKKGSDYFTLYKGGEKYLKLVKYVYFDSNVINEKKTNDELKIYFFIDGQRFVHRNNHKIDTCSVSFLKKIKLSKPSTLQQDTYEYFKEKKIEQEKIRNNKFHLLFPIRGFQDYVKVYILEKINNDKLLKYEVDWEYSMF